MSLSHSIIVGTAPNRRRACEYSCQTGSAIGVACGTNSDTGGSDDTEALRAVVRALPRSQREAIELLKLRELSLKEAAAATGMTVGALKVATHRAMAALKRVLAARETHGH